MHDLVEEREAAPPPPRPRSTSLVVRFGERYGLEPARVLDTLKATAFRTEKPISDHQMMALMIVAERHGLDPFTREIYAFPDSKGGGIVPVVSVDGWARIINEHPMLDGIEFRWDPTERAMTCVIYRKDRSHPIAVTEYLDECRRDTAPWRSHPRRMIRHKALIQCARLAFGFAGIYDEDEAARIAEAGAERIEPQSTGAQRVRASMARNPPAASPVVPMVDVVDDEAAPSYGELCEWLLKADSAATAADVVDLAHSTPGITDAQSAELAEMWRAKWQPPEDGDTKA